MTRIIDEVTPIRSSGRSGGGGVIDDSRSFRIRTHGDITGTIRHEYECPVHGRFTAEVERASVPDWTVCGSVSAIFCGRLAEWCPPLVAIGVSAGEVMG